MRTWKKALSLLTALCMVLTLAPAAFAVDSQPETITLPNGEVREIPTLNPDEAMATSLSDLEVDSEGYYIINNMADFEKVSGQEWYSNKKFRIKGDLNFAGKFSSTDEWVGAITYFFGTLEGVKGYYDGPEKGERYPVISGIPDNCCLIYGIVGGTIKNLTFKYDGQAAFITLMPVRLTTNSNYSLTLDNITTEGYVTLTGSDQSNYSPFVYSASTGGLTMSNCVNNAAISGPIYGSVFHGYYPYVGTNYVFENCVNNADVTLNYAGMFFGNSTNLESRLSAINLTINGCENNATIRGLQGAKYLSAPIGGSYSDTSEMQKVESILNSKVDVISGAANTYENVKEIGGTGAVCVGSVETGFTATLEDGIISITRPSGTSNITKYVVAVGAYVNMWNISANKFDGTDRFSVTQDIFTSDFGDELTITADLPVIGFSDSNYGTGRDTILNYPVRYDSSENYYYDVQNSIEHYDNTYRLYVSTALTENGTPAGNGTKAAQFVTVSAYNASGELCGFINLP